MTLPPAAVIGPADSAPAAASQSQAAAWNTSQAHLTDRNPPGPEKFIFSPVVENFSAKSWKLRGSCCSSVVARSSWGSISISPAMEDRRKTADSPQQYLDKVDRLLISWVTNHLGFSSCLPSVFSIPPTWALRAAAVIRDFINGFYQNIPSYPRDAARLDSSYLNVTLQYLQVSCSSLSCDISRYVTHKLKTTQRKNCTNVHEINRFRHLLNL